MKKLNKNGFTLVELLAVIVIMGILMMVAIPSISRTIENSRKDTFINVAKTYAESARTLWAADGLMYEDTTTHVQTNASALGNGTYYVEIDSDNNFLLDQGGKSPWGNAKITGYVKISMDPNVNGGKPVFGVCVTDTKHVLDVANVDNTVARSSIATTGNCTPTSMKKLSEN